MANYVVIENGEITEKYDLLPGSWRNMSNFNFLSREERKAFGWLDVVKDHVTVNPDHTKYYLSDPVYIIEEDSVIERVTLEEWDLETQERIKAQDKEVAKNGVREHRDLILKETDWTQMLDSPISQDDKVLWQIYRQKLRDLTEVFEEEYPTFRMRENMPEPPSIWPKLRDLLVNVP
jgi:hypothetical protein